MPIHDRIYRRIEERPSRAHAFPGAVIGRYGLKYAQKGWFARALALAALVPTLIACGMLYFASRNPEGSRLLLLFGTGSEVLTDGLPMETAPTMTDALWRRIGSLGLFTLFLQQTWLAILMTPLFGARAIADDLRTQAFDVYMARPIRAFDYLIGKFLSVFAPMALFLALPPVIVLGVGHLFIPDSAAGTWPLYFRAFGAGAALAAVNSLCILGISSFGPSRRYATVLWFLLTFGSFLTQTALEAAVGGGHFDAVGFTANQGIFLFAALGVPQELAASGGLPFQVTGSTLDNILVLVGLSAFGAFCVLRRVAAGRKP